MENKKIIECIPNISEGRNIETVLKCVQAVKSVDGITLMNYSSDLDHNRSVITFMGDVEAVEKAAVNLAKCCLENIDLTEHSGEHPRVGVLDVLPFVPLRGVDEAECIELSKRVGRKIWESCKIPVVYYEKSASCEENVNLATVRHGGFENLENRISSGQLKIDEGHGYHKTAGVCVCGARVPLIAFNFNLDSSDLEIAKLIAKEIRYSSGGLPCVKALGVMLSTENTAQVTVNLTDYTKTPLHVLNEKVKSLAQKYSVKIKNTELIGLIPQRAVAETAQYYLALEDFDSETRIIESYLI